MSIFTKRKERLALEAEIQRKRKEEEQAMEAKMNINRTVGQMRRSIQRIERSKSRFIEQGRTAMKTQNETAKVGARNGLRVCLTQQKVLETMLNTVMVAQEYISMKDSLKGFTNITEVITNQLKDVISHDRLQEATLNCEKAINQNTNSFVILNEYLDQLNGSFEEFGDIQNEGLADKDIDKLFITGMSQMNNEQDEVSNKQDEELAYFENKIKEF